MRTVMLVAGLLLMASRASAVDAVCGMAVPQGETAVLTGDLACSGMQVAVTLERNATLDVNGFTLTVDDGTAVFCAHTACTVVSRAAEPGVLEGGGTAGVGISANAQSDDPPTVQRLIVDNVAVRDFDEIGMIAPIHGKSLLSRLSVSGCGGPGILASKLDRRRHERSPPAARRHHMRPQQLERLRARLRPRSNAALLA